MRIVVGLIKNTSWEHWGQPKSDNYQLLRIHHGNKQNLTKPVNVILIGVKLRVQLELQSQLELRPGGCDRRPA